MGFSEPYSAWFNALVAALVDNLGPFAKADQVQYWVDEGYDDLAPDEHMLAALTRSLPHALVSWPGGGADSVSPGGGNTHDEDVVFAVRYAAGAPGLDFAQAYAADGDEGYWGAWAVHHWIVSQTLQLSVNSFNCPPRLLSSSVIRLGRVGVLGATLRFSVGRLITFSD